MDEVIIYSKKEYSLHTLCTFDFIFCAVPDKDGLASPFDDNILAFRDGGEVHFYFGHGQHIG